MIEWDVAAIGEVLSRLFAGVLDPASAAAAMKISAPQLHRLLAGLNSFDMVPVPFDIDNVSVSYLDMAGSDFAESAFDETVQYLRSSRTIPSRLTFQLGIDDFLVAGERVGAEPDGFVFHVGRCGSTLLSNLLAATAPYVLLKEPQLLNSLISRRILARSSAEVRQTDALVAAALRILCYSSRRTKQGQPRNCIVKFSSWNIREAKSLLELFPRTPAVFLFRQPAQTVASFMHERPPWFDEVASQTLEIQGRYFPTILSNPADGENPVGLFAHGWRSAVEIALELPVERVHFIDYGELVSDMPGMLHSVASHFRCREHASHSVVASTAGRQYSKEQAGETFDPSGRHWRPPLAREDWMLVDSITASAAKLLQLRVSAVASASLALAPRPKRSAIAGCAVNQAADGTSHAPND